MAVIPKTYLVFCANSTIQTLDESVIAISSAWIACTSSLQVGLGISLTQTVGSALPTQFNFTGTPTTPGNTLALGYSPAAQNLMIVKAVTAAGDIAGY